MCTYNATCRHPSTIKIRLAPIKTCTNTSKINVTTKGVTLSEKLQLTAAL